MYARRVPTAGLKAQALRMLLRRDTCDGIVEQAALAAKTKTEFVVLVKGRV